ncbi:MAG: choice-of-anchor P family protein [Candidatus Rokuibacteriota bacterium]
MVRHRAVHAAIVALAVLALGASAAAQGGPASSARAIGVRVVLPDGTVAAAAAVNAPPRGGASLDGWSYGDGAVVTGSISTSARTGAGSGSATANGSASVRSVSLFGGEVTAGAVSVQADARAAGSGASGSLSPSSVSDLVVLGQAAGASANGRVPLGDWGYAVMLEQAVVRTTSPRRGYRGFVTGLHVVLTADHGGLSKGTEIMIGYSEAAASAPKPKPAPPPPSPQPSPAPKGDGPSPEPPSTSTPQVPPTVKQPPPNVKPKLTEAGYVFPIYGPASTSDSFGAPRTTTWHHGNDIFAPLGAPILAVADGTLVRVGWNDVGGNRFWLRDGAGNEFYYAHLSAFSPLAQEGAQVQAGDVIGFVGTTGDAAGTPPHLHFEIHPRELLWMGYDGAIDPYPYLQAWLRVDDLAFGAWRPEPGSAPKVGAVLLQADDISSLSGLGDDTLSSYLVVSDLFGEAEPGPMIVGADPGFSG